MPQSLLKVQLKEKPTNRVWCLYSSLVNVYRSQAAEWMSRKSGFVRCLHPEIPITLVMRDTLYGGKVQAGRH
jgi:hypothetical protein